MRCKIHPSASVEGVCATCLRERLTALAAAIDSATDADFLSERRRYLGRSTSSNTFGLRPAGPDLGRAAATDASDGGGDTRKRVRGLSFFSSLIGHSRHRDRESSPVAGRPWRSRSWLFAMFRGRMTPKKKKTSRVVLEERVIGRGMSPAEKEVMTDLESETGYHTESSSVGPRVAPSPMRGSKENPYGGRNRHRDGRFTGLALCFSPLMRPSLGNRRNQEPSEVGFSGELHGTFNTQRHRYGGSSVGGSSFLGPNRSRKIADFGKFR